MMMRSARSGEPPRCTAAPAWSSFTWWVGRVRGSVCSSQARGWPDAGAADRRRRSWTLGASSPMFALLGGLMYDSRRGGSSLVRAADGVMSPGCSVGLFMPGIDNYAHAGGFAGGYLAGRWLDPLKPERIDHMVIAAVCVSFTASPSSRRRLRLWPRMMRFFGGPGDRRVTAAANHFAISVEIDDPADPAAARRTESHPVAREHDAVGLRAVEASRLVVARPRRRRRPCRAARSSAASPRTPAVRERARPSRTRARCACGSPAAAPESPRECFSNASFGHGVGSGVPGVTRSRHFSDCRVEQRGDVRLPRLQLGRRAGVVGDLRGVVLVGQRREVVAELVDEHVVGERAVDRRPSHGR